MGVWVAFCAIVIFLTIEVTICQTVHSMTHEDCPRCENGGNCTGTYPDLECSCRPGFYGMRCEMCENRTCSPGICVEYKNMVTCLCPGGKMMSNCPMECTNRTCPNGGTCMISKDGSPRCKDCPQNFSGRYCEVNETDKVDCQQTMCRENNTRICTNTSQEAGVMCHCKQYFTGKYCEVKLCKTQMCDEMGYSCNMSLSTTMGDCKCMKGWTGQHCEIMIDPCANMTCMNNGTCRNESGVYRCICEDPWQGDECNDMETTPPPPPRPTVSLPQECLDYQCDIKADDGICDGNCSLKICRHDGFVCSAGTNPWEKCKQECGNQLLIFNTHCDTKCQSEECLFDGFDCLTQGFGKETCDDDEYCSMKFDDGTCDDKCNVSACGYDGLDCAIDKDDWHPVNRLGSLTIRLAQTNLTNNQIGYHLSRILRTILYQRKTSKPDMMSNMMIAKEVIYDVDNRFGCDVTPPASCWTNVDAIANTLGAYVLVERRKVDSLLIFQQISGARECPLSLFGPNCARTCSDNCKNDRCDKITGACLMQCNAGFTGYNCTTECMDGYYGENCAYTCPKCKNSNCNKALGSCLEGCVPGYTGSQCLDKCQAGRYGEGCVMKCSETCADICGHMTGTCNCKPGYRGDKCMDDCEKGQYGQNCSIMCSRNCEEMECHAVSGHCSDKGCKPGYTGDRCTEMCPRGRYGKGCMNNCSVHCFNMDNCNKMNGKCQQCKDGYTGEMCDKNPAKATPPPPPSRRSGGGSSGGIIAGIIILIIAIIIAICIAVWFWRRSQGGDYDLDKKPMTERPIPMDQMEIENELVAGNHLSTAALVPLDSSPDNESSAPNKSGQDTMADEADQNAIGNDETKPLIEENSERKEPEDKESGGERESTRNSVYQPEVEGGPGGVYVGPGKAVSETISEKASEDEQQTPTDQDAKDDENQESNDRASKPPDDAPNGDQNPTKEPREVSEEEGKQPNQESEENAGQTNQESEENAGQTNQESEENAGQTNQESEENAGQTNQESEGKDGQTNQESEEKLKQTDEKSEEKKDSSSSSSSDSENTS